MVGQDYGRALAARDTVAMRSLLATHVEFHSPLIANPGFEGIASVMALFDIVFREAEATDVTAVLGGGDTVAVVTDTSFSGRPTDGCAPAALGL